MGYMDKQPNVFILTADSLQYPYFREESQTIANAVDGVNFTEAIATACRTSAAMPGLTASTYKDQLSTWGLPSSGDPTPLAEVLKREGYFCSLWTDNYLFGANYNYDRGFEVGEHGEPKWPTKLANWIKDSPLAPTIGFFEWGWFNVYKRLTEVIGDHEPFYRTARQLDDAAIEWLSTASEPYCGWLHYMDTHHPYEPSLDYREELSFNMERPASELQRLTRDVAKANGEGFSQADIEDAVAAYRGCCRQFGDELKRFVTELIDRGHFDPDRDVFVFTADHGESLTPSKTDMFGHVPDAFWDEVVHVPLVMSLPDWVPEVINEQVSLIDIMPTILKATGCAVPESADGTAAASPRDLLRESAYSVAQHHPEGELHTYRSVRTNSGWKLFGARKGGEDRILLTRVDQARDAEEVVYEAYPDQEVGDADEQGRWSDLIDLLASRGGAISVGETSFEETDVDTEHLKDLGYL